MNVTYLPIINPEIVTGVSMLLLFVFIRDKFNAWTWSWASSPCFWPITFAPYVILSIAAQAAADGQNTFEAAQDLGVQPGTGPSGRWSSRRLCPALWRAS